MAALMPSKIFRVLASFDAALYVAHNMRAAEQFAFETTSRCAFLQQAVDHRVERTIGKLKQLRRIATRYDRIPENYLASLYLAALAFWC
mgnify:CR=1 FL=1